MNSNLLKYLVIALFAFSMGCQKDNNTISELIIGRWDWVKTIIPYGRQLSNPQTVGFSETLEFMRTLKIICLVLILMACTKENDYKSVGTITGIDDTR
jgi:hypothetical protein